MPKSAGSGVGSSAIDALTDVAISSPAASHILAHNGTLFRNRLGTVYDIRDFGAVGDGVADSTTGFQAAIDAAVTNGGIVFVPPGVFRITAALVMRSFVSVMGTGWKSIIKLGNGVNLNCLKSAATNDATMIDSVVLCNFAVDGNKLQQTDGESAANGGIDKLGLALNGIKNSLIERVYVHDSVHTGIYLAGPNNLVDKCRVTDVGVAGVLTRSGVVFNYLATPHNGCRATNNYVNGIREHGIKAYPDAEDVIIAHNIVGTALDFGIWLQGCHESAVLGNTVDGATEIGIYIGVDATHGVAVDNNIVQNTLVDGVDGGGHGIQFNNVTGGTCNGNILKDNGSVGLRITGTTTALAVSGNSVTGNVVLGIYETGAANYNCITGNACRNNGSNSSSDNASKTGANTVLANNVT